MLPIYLGGPDRRLFGIFHARNQAVPTRASVLLCNAFGREGVQLHRLYRVLAERLSRNGFAVLRFDYHGTGDSAGEDLDADVEAWRDDIRVAHAELTRRAAGDSVVWMGARLGATLAHQAAAGLGIERLVLLDPIGDGRDYLDWLDAQHWLTLIETERARHPRRSASFRADDSQYLDEAGGFAVSPRLCDQLRALRFSPTSPARDTVVVCDAQTPAGQQITAICAAPGSAVRVVNFQHDGDWTSSLAPPQLLNVLVGEIGGRA